MPLKVSRTLPSPPSLPLFLSFPSFFLPFPSLLPPSLLPSLPPSLPSLSYQATYDFPTCQWLRLKSTISIFFKFSFKGINVGASNCVCSHSLFKSGRSEGKLLFIVGSTFSFPSAPHRDNNEALKIDPFIFWNGGSVRYLNLSWSFIFHRQGVNTASDTCTFCRWLWWINWLYHAEIKWWRDDDDEQIRCLCMSSHFWDGVKSEILPEWFQMSAFLPEWNLQLARIQTGNRGICANLERRKTSGWCEVYG